nr:immunoglobulin heavy chain junction region [Mus musculus]
TVQDRATVVATHMLWTT